MKQKDIIFTANGERMVAAMKSVNAAGWTGRNANEGLGFIGSEGALGKKSEDKNEQLKNGSIFVVNRNSIMEERIAKKRESARKQATKAITDQFARDNEIADEMNRMRERNKEINEEIKVLQEQEELLKNGQTEGQEASAVYEEAADNDLSEQIEALRKEQSSNTRSITDTKINSVKNMGMLKAAKIAETILDEASKQIQGMLLEEAKAHIDQEMEERLEAAKAEAEKKEEEQEKLDAAKEEREEQQELTEKIQESVSEQDKLQEEIDKIMKEAELLKEDLKGLLIDETL